MITAQGLGYTFVADDMASGPITRLNANVRGLAKSSEAAQLAYNRNMGLIMSGTKQLMAGGIMLLGINSLTKSYGKFQHQLVSAGAIMNATAGEMRALEKAAIKAGIETQFDPREAAQGLETLGAAGMNARDAIATLEPVLDLAAASLGQLGVAEASANVVGVLNAFGDATNMASKRVDQLVRVTQLSNFQARDFSIAISQAAAQAAAGDQTFESMVATLGMLRNTNLDASSSATAYREAIRRLAGDKRSLRKLSELGIDTLNKETGKIKDMGRIIAELIPKVQALDAQERNLALKRIFGVRGMKTYNAFFMSYKKAMKEGKVELGDFAGAHRQLVEGLEAAGGAAARTREKLLATAEGRRILLKGSIETFKVVAGKAFVPAVLPVLKQLTDSLNVLIQIVNKIPAGLRGFLSHFVGAVAVMLTFSGLLKIIVGARGLMGLQAASNVATAATTRLTMAQARQNMVMARGQGLRARMGAQAGMMRAGFAGVGAALPYVGLAVALYSAYQGTVEAARKKEIEKQKQILENQRRIKAEYRNTARAVETIGRAAADVVAKLVKLGGQKQLLQLQETIRKNIVKAEKAEAQMITNVNKLHNKSLSKKERQELVAQQLRLKKEAETARRIVEVNKYGELQVRARMIRGTAPSRRAERENRLVVAAASARIREMMEGEKGSERALKKSIMVARGAGQKESAKRLTAQLTRLQRFRKHETFKYARLAGYRGKDLETAQAAISGYAEPVMSVVRKRGRRVRPAGIDEETWKQITQDPTAAMGGLGLTTSEQRYKYKRFDPMREFTKGMFLPGAEAEMMEGRMTRTRRETMVFGDDPEVDDLQRHIVNAVIEGMKRAQINLSIDGESVPTKKAGSSERSAEGKPSAPQMG